MGKGCRVARPGGSVRAGAGTSCLPCLASQQRISPEVQYIVAVEAFDVFVVRAVPGLIGNLRAVSAYNRLCQPALSCYSRHSVVSTGTRVVQPATSACTWLCQPTLGCVSRHSAVSPFTLHSQPALGCFSLPSAVSADTWLLQPALGCVSLRLFQPALGRLKHPSVGCCSLHSAVSACLRLFRPAFGVVTVRSPSIPIMHEGTTMGLIIDPDGSYAYTDIHQLRM